jgi:hypothetical protein
MRRKSRSTIMKNELGQSVDHFKRAATIAAHETSATVGPKLTAARDAAIDRVHPAASKAKETASTGWDSAVATITPLVAAAGDTLRQAGKVTKKQAKANRKIAKRKAAKLEKRAHRALGRKQGGRKAGKLIGFALLGTAVGAGAAYVVRKRKAAQWDEYDPTGPVPVTPPVTGADDAAFEPVAPANSVYGDSEPAGDVGTPEVTRTIAGKPKD